MHVRGVRSIADVLHQIHCRDDGHRPLLRHGPIPGTRPRPFSSGMGRRELAPQGAPQGIGIPAVAVSHRGPCREGRFELLPRPAPGRPPPDVPAVRRMIRRGVVVPAPGRPHRHAAH
ncbi:MAG: hypothetical protein ACK55I_43575, partial [bacterium]